MLPDDKPPPLPKCDIYDPNRFGVGWREASVRAYGRSVEAAARAEVEPLVRQMVEALELIVQWNRDHARDQYGDPNKAETWACIRKSREVLGPARAWLSPHDERMAAALLSPRISIPPSMGREEVRAWIEKHAQADKPGGVRPQDKENNHG